MNRKIAAYWRQVHAVQRMTGSTSALARRAVTRLRAERGYLTAAETKRHPRIVGRIAREVGRTVRTTTPRTRAVLPVTTEGSGVRAAYRDLDDWIETWEPWDGSYETLDVETNVDY